MTKPDTANSSTDFVRQADRFVRDFAAFAGSKGVWGAALAIAAATFEGVGIVLLVPLLSIVTAGNDNPGLVQKTAARLFDTVGAETRTTGFRYCSVYLPPSSSYGQSPRRAATRCWRNCK